jgi:prephenate dehydrogenase
LTGQLTFGSAILFGEGGVGKLLRTILAGHVESLTIVDLHRGDHRSDNTSEGDVSRIVADVTAPIERRLECALAAAELVICALPEDALEATLPQVIAAAPPGALLVDTASVKSRLSRLWGPNGPSILSINPMFAPSLSPAGRPALAVCAGRPGRQQDFLEVLQRNGIIVMKLADADEHDRLTAVVQAGVHAATLAYGLTLVGAGFTGAQVAELAPPPCRQQLMLLARMVAQPPEVYEDIQRSNPHAEQVRADLIKNIAHIGRLATTRHLAEAIDSIGNWLGDARIPLADLCQNVYAELTTQGSEKPVLETGSDS